jgi:hypothetical protein
MKIICKSKEEYDDLMKASKYLHDFNIHNNNECLDPDIGGGIIGHLVHLYLGEKNPDDFINKKDFVWIEDEK